MTSVRLAAVLAVSVVSQAAHGPPVTAAGLGGEQRYLTLVSTDKPIYREGETVYLRGVVLEAHAHTPLPTQARAPVTIKGPKGEAVFAGTSLVQEGAFGFTWTVPAGAPGGEYTAVSSLPGQAPGERKFDVRAYRAPRLKSQIVFARDGYGPGDTLTATLETLRAEGGVPTGATVTAVARVDGADVATAPCRLDASGHCTVSLKLPTAIERGEGVLRFTIEDGGVVETATRTIPILVQAFDIALYPEGGALVAGLPTRVYLEARTPARKPADIAGVVVDATGAEVARFRTEHEGRGRFELSPRAGQRYTLKVTEPAGVRRSVPLPEVAAQGGALRALADVVGPADKVKLAAAWTPGRAVKLVLAQREKVLDSAVLEQPGATVALEPGSASGVLVATLYDLDGHGLAERLVYRTPAQQLTVELSADRPRYVPGAPVQLTVRTRLGGVPVPAVVGLSVTDDSVQELLEKRDQAPSLPVMALLEPEVKDLADARVYLDAANPKSRLAVDLLLGTQGWRRFAWVTMEDFLAREGDAARRVLALVQPMRAFELADAMAGAGALGAAVPPEAPRPAPRPQEHANRPAVPPPAGPPPVAAPPPAPPRKQEAAPVQAQAQEAPARAADRDDAAAGALAPRLGKAKMDREMAGLRRRMPMTTNYISVREFAHQVRPERKPDDRLDFAETLYWGAAVKTDASGQATVRFGTSDAVTSFRAQAGGYTPSGALGSAEVKLESVKPFYLEPKLPLEVTAGDVVRLPVAFVNGTREPLGQVAFSLTTRADLRFAATPAFGLQADQRARKVVALTVGPGSTSTELTLTATAGGYRDVVTRPLSIQPRGFPVKQESGGLLAPGGRASARVTLAPDTVAGSVATSIAVYPSPAGNLGQALKRLLNEPSGCFEQTSSTTYPLTMALQYFQTHTGTEPEVVKDAQAKLDRGYQRLTGYECKGKGFEWFGEDPGHEALTAYGLLQFTDMQKVRQVDGTMLSNTRAWLLKQRDGKGGFERRRRALHTWVEDRDASDAYITWALLEAGERQLGAEVAHVKAAAAASANTYVVALGANVAALAGDVSARDALLRRLAALQGEQGLLTGATGSIVGSQGRSLAIETTALATLAWLRVSATGAPNPFAVQVQKAMKALAEASTDGSYGATQSTVLALRAVLETDRQQAGQRKAGQVRLLVDGKPLGGWVPYQPTATAPVALPDAAELLGPGAHTLELVQEGGGQLPWTVSVVSSRLAPETSPEAQLDLEVSLPRQALGEGDVVEATARVTNRSQEPLPTVVAIVGVPGGLEPRIDALKELVKQHTIDAYEVRGRDVVLYWRGMTSRQQVRVPVSLVAAVPGTYTGPASRAYPYYAPERKSWVPGLAVDIRERD